MTWPTPAPGLVIRYAYLWEEAARAGREEGEKDRPCAVLLVHREEDGRIRVYALPITHSAPAEPGDGIEIPTVVKEHLGLDDARSWVILTEANVFYWPGPDLRFPREKGPAGAAYGFLPPKLFRTIRDRFLELRKQRRAQLVSRSE
ncbi:hypothetical protein [Inquilinus limosus]|uniref:hypothetical protein n=1 Tax=Inquilinus limosus TaxID=171674 RepID=UPI00041E3E87|nr:hypothetical protein [Inquilinus limosus]